MQANENSANLVLRKGRVIDPAHGLDAVIDVLIENGIIAEMRANIELGASRGSRNSNRSMRAANGLSRASSICMFICVSREKNTRRPSPREHRPPQPGGFTSVACMPNTHPVNDCAAVTQYILEKARDEGSCRVFPVGAISKGTRGKEHFRIRGTSRRRRRSRIRRRAAGNEQPAYEACARVC